VNNKIANQGQASRASVNPVNNNPVNNNRGSKNRLKASPANVRMVNRNQESDNRGRVSQDKVSTPGKANQASAKQASKILKKASASRGSVNQVSASWDKDNPMNRWKVKRKPAGP
jgi:hypothetical protein